MKPTKKTICISLVLLIFLISLSFSVLAYKRLCLSYGQNVPSNDNPVYTCFHDSCQVCVTDNNYPTAPYKCDDISGCEASGTAQLDITPPNITFKSPINNSIYNSRSVLFEFTINEPSSVYYIDNIEGRGRWSRFGSDIEEYSRGISFKYGLNDITIKAIDRNDNEALYNFQFYVDSKKPRISRTDPRSGFVTGDFYVEFTEANPKQVLLNYGNEITGFRETQVDLSNCYMLKQKYHCDVNVDLSDYDGQDISYIFEVIDIANNSYQKGVKKLTVDTTSPVLNNPTTFWYQGAGRYSNYIYFNFNVTEENLDDVSYMDYGETNPRFRLLCSRLNDEGVCETRKSFRAGHHPLTIQITDKAGNAIATYAGFDVY